MCEGAGPAVAGFLRARVLTVSFASPRSALVKTSRVRLVRRHSPEAALDAPPVNDDGDVRGWCSRVGADGSLRLREELRGRGPRDALASSSPDRPPPAFVDGDDLHAPEGIARRCPAASPSTRPTARPGWTASRLARRTSPARTPRATSSWRAPPSARAIATPSEPPPAPIARASHRSSRHPPRRPPRRPRRASRRAPRPLLRPVPPRLAARHPRTRRIAPGRRRPRRRRKSPLAG